MAVTNDPLLLRKMKQLRSHGISSDKEDMHPRAAEEIWNYQQIDLGFNYRMTDIHAALGMSQMYRLDEFVNRRQAIAQRYDELLLGLPAVTPWQHPDSFSSVHLYVIRLKLDSIALSQRQVYEELHASGVFVNLHYIPVYRHPYYEQFGFRAGYCPEAEAYYAAALSLPMYAALTNEQQNHVVQTLKSILATQ